MKRAVKVRSYTREGYCIKGPIKVNHPSQQDTLGDVPNSFTTTAVYKKTARDKAYLLTQERDGWRYGVIEKLNGYNKVLASGWALYREQAEVEISKAIRGVM